MSRLRAALKLTVIVGGLLAVPLVLYATVGNPLPVLPVDWGLVAESLTTGAIATGTWLKVVAVGGWLLWGHLVVTVVVEVAAALRGRASRVRAVPIQWLASTIVALATQLSTVSAPAVSGIAPAAAITVAYDTSQPAVVEPARHGIVPAGARLVVVVEGDSWAGFAASTVGDAEAAATIRRLNHGRDVGGHVVNGSEAFVEAGWQLAIPAADVDVPATADVAPRRSGDSETDDTAAATWTVQKGDHLWAIAKQTLEAAWGRTPTDGQMVGYWRELVEHNRHRLAPPHDPNLIFPGQQFVLPPPPSDPAGTPAASEDREHVTDRDEPPSADAPAADIGQAPDSRPSPEAEPEPPSDASVDDRHVEPAAPAPTEPSDTDTEQDADGARTAWGTPATLTAASAAAMLLAGGVLAAVRRRRRVALAQRPVQVRLPALTDEQAAQMARLEAAAPADETLDELADLLASIPERATPTLVDLEDDGTVRLMFEGDHDPQAPPPAPWVLAHHLDTPDGEAMWVARLGDRGPRRSIGLPLLVTLGRAARRTVLGNVAAMRRLTVTADDPATLRRRLHALALEVATSPTAGPVEVAVAGDTPPAGIEQLVQVDDPAAVVAAAEADQQLLAEDRLPRLVVCHDPATAPGVPADVGLLGVVLAGGSPTDGWWLRLDGPRTILHAPDGRQHAFDSPDFDADLIRDQLTALNTVEPPPAVGPDLPADTVTAEPVEPGWCDIGLLGPVTVTCDGEPVETLAPIPRQVLIYLATHPGATSDQLEDAVWAGRVDVSGGQYRVRNALRRLRTVLGDTPDGAPLVPRRGPTNPTMRLSAAVTTDLDRALAHLDAARHLDGDVRMAQLLAALDLVRGAPFADMPVTWAADIEHQAIARLQDAAVAAAEMLIAAGRYDDAEHAVQQGLRLCDPYEPLYVAWARIEHARQQPHRIPQLWTRLRQRYAEDTDDTFESPATPTVDTEQAFAALLGRHTTTV